MAGERWRCGLKICGLLIVGIAGAASAADVPALVAQIKSVRREAAGADAARTAWKELAACEASSLPALLAGFEGADPLAINYLRSAAETIAQRCLESGGQLPSRQLEQFLLDREHEARARRLAFELLARVDETASDRLIPLMADDPSVELRRDAVARLLAAAGEQLEQGSKEEARAAYALALKSARDDDQVQAAKKRLEELGEKVDLPAHFGFVVSWRLLAPFDNTAKKGFEAVYPPEKESALSEEYAGKDGMKIGWVDHTTDHEYGLVDIAKAIAPYKGAVCYAAAEFPGDREVTVDFRLGTPNAWKLWLNGELLFGREEYHRGMSLDQYRVRGKLRRGKNTILLKVCQNEQTDVWAQAWQYQLRVCDGSGTAVAPARDEGQASAKGK